MIRFVFSSFLALLVCSAVSAQTLHGRVVDEKRQPVVGVAVVMLSRDSLYLGGVTTDTLGRFALASPARPCRLLFQHIAYEPRVVEAAGDDAGEIVLRENANAIEEVVVEGERPVVKVDEGRLAYDLETLTKGKAVNNAYEALMKLPGVSERDGVLELTGMGPITVILNGRATTMGAEQLAELLRATPVERIEKAELMYSAPPQYHVRGAAVNLVMRRSRERNFAGEIHGGYSSQFYHDWDAGGNVVYTAPKWSADATYSVGQSAYAQFIDLYSRHTLGEKVHDITQDQRLKSWATQHLVRTSVEYAPEGRGRLSAAYTARIKPLSASQTRAAGSWVKSLSYNDGDDAMHNLLLRYTAASGLDLSADYTRYHTAMRTGMRNDYTDGRRTAFGVVSGQRIDRLSLDADKEHTLGAWKLNYGATFRWAGTHDWQHYTIHEGEVASEETDSRLDEFTGSIYAGFGRNFKKGNFSLSMSGEYYRLGDYENWSLYPQATMMWMPAESHLVQLSLSSDKTYPSYWEMQEAVSYIDGYSELHGTPGLRPMRSYEGQLLYMYRQKYTFALFWNEMPDFFLQTAYQATDRLSLVYQSINWNTNRQWGANAVVPFRIGRWLDTRVTLIALRMRQRCDEFYDFSFDRSKWVGVARMENTVRLAKKPDLTLDIAGYYQSPAIQGTFDVDPSWGVDAGAKWTFAKGKASLVVRCTDIFNSTNPFVRVRYAGQYIDMGSGFHTRTVSVKLSCRLGGYKERQRRKVDTSRFGH